MNTRRATIIIVIILVLAASAVLVRHILRHRGSRPPYWVSVLHPLPGGKASEAFDINDSGLVVGRADFQGSHFHQHAVVWEKGVPRDLGTLDGGGSEADCISKGGRIVGWSSYIHKRVHAVEFTDGKLIDFGTVSGTISLALGVDDSAHTLMITDTPSGAVHSYWLTGPSHSEDIGTLPGFRDTTANAISASGTVVGTVDNGAGGSKRAFLWKNGSMRLLPLPSHYTDTRATAINSSDEIVGSCSIGPSRFHAVAWVDGRPTLLAGTRDKESSAFAINDAGDIVGQCNNHACLWRRGKLIDLNNRIGPHGRTILNEAVAINNGGDIACNGTVNQRDHAYLLTPSKR